MQSIWKTKRNRFNSVKMTDGVRPLEPGERRILCEQQPREAVDNRYFALSKKLVRVCPVLFLGVFGSVSAHAADLSSEPLPNSKAPLPASSASGFSGPLATFAEAAAERGFTFHAVALDFAEVNPSLGLQRGRAANSLYVIEGVDADLGKLIGLQGTSVHFENAFFPATENLNIAPEIGDSQVGYQPPFTPRIARLTRATMEQKAFGDRFDVEVGITHPGYYYASFNCSSMSTCFQDLLYLNAGYTSYSFAVPGGNISYSITPSIYVQGGVFAQQVDANDHIGYDFPNERYDGVLAMGEIGLKTNFSNDPYPSKVSFTGFVNTQNHADLTANSAFSGLSSVVSGTSGLILQGEKVIWRRDGAADLSDHAPTALKIYGSFGSALDSTIPVQTDAWIGATLMAPFAGRPGDTFGVKFDWQRLNSNYTSYLTAANFVSGGPGFLQPYKRDSFVLEGNAHISLPYGMAFEPVVQYEINPNSYFDPLTPLRAHDGFYLGGTYVIPIGTMLGLQAAN